MINELGYMDPIMLAPAPLIASKRHDKNRTHAKKYLSHFYQRLLLHFCCTTDSATHINAPLTSMPATPTLAEALVLATPVPPTPSLP
ncbi:hypothetical protein Tco_1201207 [Tanacetum coccineum]